MADVKYQLPAKLDTYLWRVLSEYTMDLPRFAEIISSARVLVVEQTYGWDNVTGHDVKFFLSRDVMKTIKINETSQITEKIARDLNECASSLTEESVNRVVLELENESDPEFQQSRPVSRQPAINPDTLSIWNPRHVRVFISHRDEHRAAARAFANELEGYGISAFVAHEAISAMSAWRREVENGLRTMDVMVAYITNDFHEGAWTDQEVGFAKGNSVPIIPLKVEQNDPQGFLAEIQAVRGHMNTPKEDAKAVYEVLAEKLGNKARLQEGVISAFGESPNWDEARDRFRRMEAVVKKLSGTEAEQIASAFCSNDQLYNANYLINKYARLKAFLEKAQPWPVTIAGRMITFKRPRGHQLDDDTLF